MSEDKELVEVWRKEFEKLMPNANLSKHPEGDYVRDPIDAMWRGFLMAKRTQPSVVLPKPLCTYADHSYPAYTKRQLIDLLTAAGIKYTIGE